MKLLEGRTIRPLDAQLNKNEPSRIPKLPSFTLSINASRGAGKTTLLLNMLLSKSILAGKFNEIYIISQSSALDDKMNVLRQTNGILAINHPLLKLLKKNARSQKILEDPDTNKIPTEYKTHLDDENFKDTCSIKFIEKLMNQQRYIITKYSKTVASKILLIFDDCISNKKFFNSTIIKNLIQFAPSRLFYNYHNPEL